MFIFKNIWFLVFYGYPICKKYGLPLVFITRTSGEYHLRTGLIKVSLFKKYFIPTLLHEVGHHVYSKKRYGNWRSDPYCMAYTSLRSHKNTLNIKNYKESVIKEEAKASLFALRMTKSFGLYNKEFTKDLYKALRTYCYKALVNIDGVSNYADIDSFACKNLHYNPLDK